MGQDFRALADIVLEACVDTFGETVLYYPKSGGSYKVSAIFDNEFSAIDPGTDQLISTNQSVLGINLNDFKENNVKNGDIFKIRNASYRVIDQKEDGQGGASLLIQKTCKDEKTDIRKYKRRS